MQSVSDEAMTPYGAIRINAEPFIQGPRSVEYHIDGEQYHCPRLLTLEQRFLPPDVLESRSVYLDLFDHTTPFAVLRGVRWDGERMKRERRVRDPKQVAIQARFVLSPINRISEWLKKLDGLDIVIRTRIRELKGADTRRLQLQIDPATQAFELLWNTGQAEFETLNSTWMCIWGDMGKSLIEHTPTNVAEHFYDVNPEVVYDFESYNPL